jgi:hypothetical protein
MCSGFGLLVQSEQSVIHPVISHIVDDVNKAIRTRKASPCESGVQETIVILAAFGRPCERKCDATVELHAYR